MIKIQSENLKSLDGTIHANYANFGYIPYGKTIIGKIHYEPDDELVCSELDQGVYNATVGFGELTPFYLARRGECSFVQKIRSMENIGIAVGIVVDSYPEENIKNVLMSDDGTGGGIRIPSMIISQKDGDKLINWLKTATAEEIKSLIVLCEFKMDYNDDDTVNYDYWFTSSSDRALDFLEDFRPMENKLHGLANFTPHYVFWECPDCDPNYVENDCFGGGKYCALEAGNMAIKGQEIILEDLRQACLWKNLKATN